MKLLSCVWLLATHWTAAHQAPLSVEFSRQEYWSGVPLPSPMLALRGEYYDLQQEGSIMISNLQMRKLRIKKFEINWVISHNWYKAVWGWSFHAGLHCGPCASLAGQPTPLHVNCVCSAIRRKTFMSKTPLTNILLFIISIHVGNLLKMQISWTPPKSTKSDLLEDGTQNSAF